jgi:hypothetical protein
VLPDYSLATTGIYAVMPPYPYYPYWNGMFTERNPPPVPFNVPTEPPA